MGNYRIILSGNDYMIQFPCKVRTFFGFGRETGEQKWEYYKQYDCDGEYGIRCFNSESDAKAFAERKVREANPPVLISEG